MIHYLRALVARLRGLFGDHRADREFDDEIETHLRLLTERYVRQGMTEGEAIRAARRQFGNVTLLKEDHREMRGIRFIETLFQDLRYGIRMLGRNPGFTFVAALTLALGIGANTAIFSVVNAVLLRPLPYPEAGRLVMIEETGPGFGNVPVPVPDFNELVSRNQMLEQMTAYRSNELTLTGNGNPERLEGEWVSNNYFQLFGVSLLAGRAFAAEEHNAGHANVVIISHRLWQRRFGAEPGLIGQTLTLDQQNYTVVGVAPPGFQFSLATDLWLPLSFTAEEISDRGNFSLSVIGRLKLGVTVDQAQEQMSGITRRLGPPFPGMAKGVLSVRLEPLHSRLVKNVRLNLLLLWGAVGIVLLIACANFANLLLARAATRRKELAVRTALGAGRRRLVRQLLTESAMLSLLGGVVGLTLAHWGARALLAISAEQMPRINEIRINGWVVGFTLSLSLLTGVVFGLIPALSSSRIDLTGSLKDGASVTTTGFRLLRQHQARSLLVVSEIMLALVLLAGAGLLIKSFLRLLDLEKGFAPENVLTLLVELPETKYPEAHQTNAFWQRLIKGIEKLPGVQIVAITSSLPLTKRGALTSIQIAGRAPESLPVADDLQAGGLPPPPGGGFGASAVYSAISPDYFRAMGIALRRGRQFSEQDIVKKPPVVIISETMARRYWPGEDAIGRQINPGFSHSSWFTVVGVVSNVRHFRLEAEARPEMYFPYLQILDENAAHSMSVVIRATVAPASLANAVRKQVWGLDAEQPIMELATMEEKLATVMTTRRFNLLTLGTFAALALALVALGIYGVMAYHATQRTHEIGVRMALGARPRDVLALALGQGMKLTLAGVALGLVSAFALTRSMKSLLFDISATDPMIFASVTLLLVVVALIASYIPARRATKVDPLLALRQE